MLHLIGYIIMTIDHIGMFIFDTRLIVSPVPIVPTIFVLLTIRGFYKTSNRKKYLKRFAGIALISQAPYMYLAKVYLGEGWFHLNFVFALLILATILYLINQDKKNIKIIIPLFLTVLFLPIGSLTYVLLSGLFIYLIYNQLEGFYKTFEKIRLNKYFIRVYYPLHLYILAGIKVIMEDEIIIQNILNF